MNPSSPCPCCGQNAPPSFLNFPDLPVLIGEQSISSDAAKACDKGDLKLVFCPACGYIWNKAFDSAKMAYTPTYDNALDFSSVFRDFEDTLIGRLIQSYDIRDKDVIDIGCGKGHFLNRLCEEGNNRGVGFDPSYEGERVSSRASERITYLSELYSEKFTHFAADIICCRQVLEHIPQPADFLAMIRRSIGSRKNTIVYFEVPNFAPTLKNCCPWDVIYEHCGYFTVESLGELFRRCGFEILSLHETYHGQFLGIDARRTDGAAPIDGWRHGDLTGLASSVESFSDRVAIKFAEWQQRLNDAKRSGTKIAAWGAGARAVGFLNMLKVSEAVPYVVDINPHKQGLHLAGTGQEIVAPEFLHDYQPDMVILMNPIYRQEITNQLDSIGVHPELVDAF